MVFGPSEMALRQTGHCAEWQWEGEKALTQSRNKKDRRIPESSGHAIDLFDSPPTVLSSTSGRESGLSAEI
jgi:hypothetical protein